MVVEFASNQIAGKVRGGWQHCKASSIGLRAMDLRESFHYWPSVFSASPSPMKCFSHSWAILYFWVVSIKLPQLSLLSAERLVGSLRAMAWDAASAVTSFLAGVDLCTRVQSDSGGLKVGCGIQGGGP